MKDPEHKIKYANVLEMVSHPRKNHDADGNFVGYDVIQDHLDSYRDSYIITEEEHMYLSQRLARERMLDTDEE